MDVNAEIILRTKMNLRHYTISENAGGVGPLIAALLLFQFDSRMAVLIRDPKHESNNIAARSISIAN